MRLRTTILGTFLLPFEFRLVSSLFVVCHKPWGTPYAFNERRCRSVVVTDFLPSLRIQCHRAGTGLCADYRSGRSLRRWRRNRPQRRNKEKAPLHALGG